MRFVEDNDAVEASAEPVDDLLHPARFFTARLGAQRGVGGEKDAFLSPGIQSQVSYESSTTSGANAGRLTSDNCGADVFGRAAAAAGFGNMVGGKGVEGAAIVGRAGTRREICSSSSDASAAMQGDCGKARGSSAGIRSITVSRVSKFVP